MLDEVHADLGELTRFIREIRRLGAGDLREPLREASRKAAEIVVARSQVVAAATGRKEIIKAAKDTVRAAQVGGDAAIRSGSETGLSWANAAMFGTKRDAQRHRKSGSYIGYRQFLASRKGGYVVYPAIEDSTAAIVSVYSDAVELLVNNRI